MVKVIYKPTRQSSAIGLAYLGFGFMAVTFALWKWKIGPYVKKKRNLQAEEWANYVFEQEQKTKLSIEGGENPRDQ